MAFDLKGLGHQAAAAPKAALAWVEHRSPREKLFGGLALLAAGLLYWRWTQRHAVAVSASTPSLDTSGRNFSAPHVYHQAAPTAAPQPPPGSFHASQVQQGPYDPGTSWLAQSTADLATPSAFASGSWAPTVVGHSPYPQQLAAWGSV